MMLTGEIAGIAYQYHLAEIQENPTLIFIHGAGGTRKNWHHQWLALKEKYSLISLDLPGHGKSTAPGAQQISLYSQAILQLTEELRPVKPVLTGHSMGGAIAMTAAISRPELFAGLILVGTGARLRVFPSILDKLAQDIFPAEIIQYAFGSQALPEMKAAGMQEMQKTPCSVTLGDFQACNSFDVTAELGKITCPTLVICGDEDQLTPVKYSTFLHQQIPGSSLAVIPLAGHMVMLEQPASTNQIIQQFLSQKF
jgi:pimeloyl-ACP methyl ester carboxylesterase